MEASAASGMDSDSFRFGGGAADGEVVVAVDEGRVCRICLDDEPVDQLIVPCECRGSAKYVHRQCLDKWRDKASVESAAFECGTCGAKYVLERPLNTSLPVVMFLYDIVTVAFVCVSVVLCFLFLGGVRPWDIAVAVVGLLAIPMSKWVDEHGFLTSAGCFLYGAALAAAKLFVTAGSAPILLLIAMAFVTLFSWVGAHLIISVGVWVLRRGRERVRSSSLPPVVCLERHPERRHAAAEEGAVQVELSEAIADAPAAAGADSDAAAGAAAGASATTAEGLSPSAHVGASKSAGVNDARVEPEGEAQDGHDSSDSEAAATAAAGQPRGQSGKAAPDGLVAAV